MKASHASKAISFARAIKALLLAGIAASALPLSADTANVNGMKWIYQVENGEAVIYNGGMSAIPTSTSGALTIPSYLGGYPVRSIGEYAFTDCVGLTSVTIPYGVTSIGGGAFDYCTGLARVTIPGSVKTIGVWAFAGCHGLRSVTIYNGLETIEREAFTRCGLVSIDIPESVTNIGDGAFMGCRGLSKVRMPLINVASSVFSQCADNLSILYWGYDYRLVVKPNNTKYGTARGGGEYAIGATATLKATAKSGYAFAGWFEDRSCKKALNPRGYDNRNPTVEYVVPAGTTTLYAKFISKAKAKKSLKFSSATKKLAKAPKKTKMGKSFSLKLGISSATITKVSAKGLPKGLKIDKKTGKITGTPIRSGKYTATVTVKDAAGNTIKQKVKITVYVPSSIKGTYYGTAEPSPYFHTIESNSSAVTVTISSSGKVSVKVKSYKLSGARIELDDRGHYVFWNQVFIRQEHAWIQASFDINPKAKSNEDALTGSFYLSAGDEHSICLTPSYSVLLHARKVR